MAFTACVITFFLLLRYGFEMELWQYTVLDSPSCNIQYKCFINGYVYGNLQESLFILVVGYMVLYGVLADPSRPTSQLIFEAQRHLTSLNSCPAHMHDQQHTIPPTAHFPPLQTTSHKNRDGSYGVGVLYVVSYLSRI